MTTGEAAEPAIQLTDEERLQRAQLRLRRTARMALVTVGTVALAGIVLSVVIRSQTSKPTTTDILLIWGGLILFLLVSLGAALWYARRRLKPGSDGVLLASEPERAKDVLVRLNKGRPIDPDDAAFVRANIRASRHHRLLSLLFGVLGLALVVNSGLGILWQQGPIVLSLLPAVFGVLFLAFAVSLFRQHDRLARNAAAQGFPTAS